MIALSPLDRWLVAEAHAAVEAARDVDPDALADAIDRYNDLVERVLRRPPPPEVHPTALAA